MAAPTNVDAFTQRLIAACDAYNQAKVGQLSFLGSVLTDINPQVASVGQTIRSYFPDLGAVTDQGTSDWTGASAVAPTYVDTVIDSRPGKGVKVHDFEQLISSTEIVEKYIDPLGKRIDEYVNGRIAAVCSSTYFNAATTPAGYAPIVGLTTGALALTDLTAAWAQMGENRVPVQDYDKLVTISSPTVHSSMIADPQFSQESVVGLQAAQVARQYADLGVQLGARKLYDYQMPKRTGAITGTAGYTAAAKAVTGSSTLFTTELEVGDRITFAGDTQVHVVAAIASDTALTLREAGVAGASAKAVTKRTNVSILMHKFAIGVTLRSLQLVNDGTTTSILLNLKGVPVRVQLSYQHTMGGYLLTADTACGVSIMRPDFASLIYS